LTALVRKSFGDNASVEVVELIQVREPLADLGVLVGTDDWVPVRALSSPPPIRSGPMVLQPVLAGNREGGVMRSPPQPALQTLFHDGGRPGVRPT
jgi:hypothetical protein